MFGRFHDTDIDDKFFFSLFTGQIIFHYKKILLSFDSNLLKDSSYFRFIVDTFKNIRKSINSKGNLYKMTLSPKELSTIIR